MLVNLFCEKVLITLLLRKYNKFSISKQIIEMIVGEQQQRQPGTKKE